MAMPQSHVEWTLERVHALPDDGNRYEFLDGELLVSPSPTVGHQRVLARLFRILQSHVEMIGGYEVFFAPFAVTFSARRELQPDLLVLPLLPDGRGVTQFADVGRLTLAVEALSPSTERTDRVKKRPVYQEEGVPECWMVDLEARTIERWRPGDTQPDVCRSTMDWLPDPARPPLAIDVEALFRDA